MLSGLSLMHNGVMPPFAGTDPERDALAAYLNTLQTLTPNTAAADGKTIYQNNCSMCHQDHPNDQFFTGIVTDPKAAADSLKDLTSIFPLMPDLKLNDAQRAALAQYLETQRPPTQHAQNQPSPAAEGGK
jgi:mono/diheme cytochrome c family protein